MRNAPYRCAYSRNRVAYLHRRCACPHVPRLAGGVNVGAGGAHSCAVSRRARVRRLAPAHHHRPYPRAPDTPASTPAHTRLSTRPHAQKHRRSQHANARTSAFKVRLRVRQSRTSRHAPPNQVAWTTGSMNSPTSEADLAPRGPCREAGRATDCTSRVVCEHRVNRLGPVPSGAGALRNRRALH